MHDNGRRKQSVFGLYVCTQKTFTLCKEIFTKSHMLKKTSYRNYNERNGCNSRQKKAMTNLLS